MSQMPYQKWGVGVRVRVPGHEDTVIDYPFLCTILLTPPTDFGYPSASGLFRLTDNGLFALFTMTRVRTLCTSLVGAITSTIAVAGTKFSRTCLLRGSWFCPSQLTQLPYTNSLMDGRLIYIHHTAPDFPHPRLLHSRGFATC
jgi:hypothetical protein